MQSKKNETMSLEQFEEHVESVINADTENFIQLIELTGLDIKEDFAALNLTHIDLSKQNLKNSNFKYSNLSGANLSNTDLSQANFSYANLSGANLSGANLNDADLSCANLNGAKLTDTDLSGANLRGTELKNTGLHVTDLSNSVTYDESTVWDIDHAIDETKSANSVIAPLFTDLPDDEYQQILNLSPTKTYPKNTIIISEGDDPDSLYIVLNGKLKVYLSDDDGREIIINVLGEGEYFGEIALLDNALRSASVMTLEETKVAIISKSVFESCLADNPQLAMHIIRGLSLRLRQLTQNVKSLALMDVYGRVARILLDMAEPSGDKLEIRQRVTHRDIANMAGASREMVSRILKELSDGGYITIKGDGITINSKLPSGWR